MEVIDKIVEFDKYCKKCEYYESDEAVDPCHNCLNNPTNVYSKKPVEFKEKTEKKK